MAKEIPWQLVSIVLQSGHYRYTLRSLIWVASLIPRLCTGTRLGSNSVVCKCVASAFLIINISDRSSTTKKNKRVRGGQPPGVHNTNFYEVEGQTRTNPAAGIELGDTAYDVQVRSYWHPLTA